VFKTPEHCPDKMERVAEIVDLMRRGKWLSSSPREKAGEWGIGEAAVRHDAAEAGRRVIWMATDKKHVKEACSVALEKSLAMASEKGKHMAVARVADVWSKMVGAAEPSKHELTMDVSRFETMPTKNKIQWLEDRIEKMQQIREDLTRQLEEEEGRAMHLLSSP
jgi:hypothetical protein